MYDVITIGSATKDVFLVSKKFKVIKSDQFSTGLGECVPLGSKIEVDELVLTTGGGGTNAAATFANLGFKTAVVTRIGKDPSGRDILNEMEEHGVDTRYIRQLSKGETGYSTLLTTVGGERSVLVHRGVSSNFTTTDIPKNIKTRWIYMSSIAGNVALAQKIARDAAKKSINIAYNPGSLELKKGLKAFDSIMRNITVLNVNLEEAQMLAKTKTRDVHKLCKAICKTDITLIVTDGPNGSYTHRSGDTYHVRTTGAKGISRTGAGDAFGSGTVSGLIKGLEIEDALRLGTINAEAVIQKHGAKIGLLKRWPSAANMKRIKVRKLNR